VYNLHTLNKPPLVTKIDRVLDMTDEAFPIRTHQSKIIFLNEATQIPRLDAAHQQKNVFGNFSSDKFDPFDRNGVSAVFSDADRHHNGQLGELIVVGLQPRLETQLVFSATKMIWRQPVRLTGPAILSELPDIAIYQAIFNTFGPLDPNSLSLLKATKICERNGHLAIQHYLQSIFVGKVVSIHAQSQSRQQASGIANEAFEYDLIMNPMSPLGDLLALNMDLKRRIDGRSRLLNALTFLASTIQLKTKHVQRGTYVKLLQLIKEVV
jgi:hypothetical protein